ncbi:MAG TPA: hypothetical protein VK154_11395 [Chitinophagales bacterium]|nr:hypothetical protein [Chitinophagales bacterium]
MKQAFLLIAAILLLASCQRSNPQGNEGSTQNSDTAQLNTMITAAIQAEIKKTVPADSMKFEITALHIKVVSRSDIDKFIVSQAAVYRANYQQRYNDAIATAQGNKDSAAIQNQLAAQYRDTINMYDTLKIQVIKNLEVKSNEEYYQVEFDFIPIANGKPLLKSLAVMFFDRDFKVVEASAPKLIK